MVQIIHERQTPAMRIPMFEGKTLTPKQLKDAHDKRLSSHSTEAEHNPEGQAEDD